MSETTIKDRVWAELDDNPLLTPKQLCKLLGLNYKDYSNYVTKLRSDWKYYSKDKLRLKPSSFKNWRGWIYVSKLLDRKKDPVVTIDAVKAGWILTKSKNRYLLWRDPKRGRLEWFETGRCKVWVKRPASQGKAFQMLCDAFFSTGLIFDIRLLEPFLKSLRFKGATLIIKTSERLPYFKLDFLKDSNGFIFKAGDRSHPTCYEINFWYPDWGEHAEQVIARLTKMLEQRVSEPKKPTFRNGALKDTDYSRLM